MNKAIDAIISLIRGRVAIINRYRETEDYTPETAERLNAELRGMLLCLKTISSDKENYCINYLDDGIEFGYYDGDGVFVIIEK